MADNIALPGTGVNVAADDVSSVFYQIVKLAYGADGTATLMTSQPATETSLAAILAKLAAGPAAPSASQPIALPLDVTVSSSALSVINTDLLGNGVSGWMDASAYNSASIQVIGSSGIGAGAVFFEQTNDTTAAAAGQPWPVLESAVITGNPVVVATTIAASTTRIFEGPVTAKYVRVRISTAFTGGTVGVSAVFSQLPYATTRMNIVQATAGSLNANVGTVSTVNILANGQTAHSSASTGTPVRVGGRVNTAVDTTLAAGDACDQFMTTNGAAVVKPYATPETDWQYATPIASPIANTTAVQLKAAGAANVRNYLTGLQFHNSAVVASVITIQDGSTVIWTGYMPASMTAPVDISFATPLRGSAATALNVVINTTATSTFVSAQGYQAL